MTLITKQDGETEPFDRSKLEGSLLRAGTSKEETSKIVEHIEKELKEEVETSDIYKHAFSLLKKQEKPIAARYSMKRAVMALGPSGFPFENFVAEIFKKRGYDTEVGGIISGKCVDHEIDLCATKGEEIIGAEIKFHNKQGIKSDVKVALYVHARFEDLKNKGSNVSKWWLLTNTKFTKNAVKYGECVGINMVSWGYPQNGNLNDLIEEAGIQPVTSLTTLTEPDKKTLMDHKVVLCRSLHQNEKLMDELGFQKEKIKSILSESQALCSTRSSK